MGKLETVGNGSTAATREKDEKETGMKKMTMKSSTKTTTGARDVNWKWQRNAK